MKILQVIPFFTPVRGGSVIVPYNLSRELAKIGHDVTIITTDFEFDNDYANSIRNSGVKVIPFHCIVNISMLLISPSIKKWLNSNINHYDLIHMHNFRSYQNNAVLHYAKKYNVPYVLQAHGSAPRIITKKGLKKLYDTAWGHRLLQNASRLIAVSNIEVDQYIQMGEEQKKIAVIPNGLDINKLNSQKKHGEFRKKLNISNERLILFLGRIHQGKGVDFLIRSFGRVLENENDAILVVVGPDDGYRKELEKIIEELSIGNRVKFVDYISNVSEVYADADVLVYPAIYEIFGLVPFEAIICGTPVIVTDDSGCGEIVKESDCGYLVRYGDVDGLKNKIIHVLNNPDEAKKKVLQGQRYIYENLTWDKIVTKVEEVYEDCIRNV